MSARLFIIWLVALLPFTLSSAAMAADPVIVLDCAALDCAAVLPAAESFEPVEADPPYEIGRGAGGEVVGWVALSTDLVGIKGYSGKPLVTLLGLTPDGVISGARVVHHSEPILLVGIPEDDLHAFVANYAGQPATAKIEVGSSPDPEAVVFDMISGATVTVLAQNRTILDAARQLGALVGVIEADTASKGHFIVEDVPWSWSRMVDEGVFGRLTVSEADMGGEGDGAFIDLWFTLADPPQIGKALMAPGDYDWITKQLEPGEHLLVIAGTGSSSFKGSGFVRGGLFDRIRVTQGLGSIMFRDRDFHDLPRIVAEGAPAFKEAAVFVVRDGKIDPGAPFELAFIGSRYDGKGGFSREFHTFTATHRLPPSVYFSEEPAAAPSIFAQAWYHRRFHIAVLGALLALVAGLFAGRRWLTARMERTVRVHVTVMVLSVLVLGFWLRAQPSVTQVLTLIGSLVGTWDWALFLMEPLLFIFWIFIALVTVTWGRGVFCGWLCPYGSLTELIYKAARKLRIPSYELPDGVHRWLRYLRYVVLAGLVPAYLYSPELGEKLAEIEPFKTTFFVTPWAREWLFLGWWLFLLLLSTANWRPFCRYVCPLGAALAIPGSLRFLGPKRRRFCSHCTICARGCEPRAIRRDGSIDPRDCLSCMECEANYNDKDVCPPLVGLERLVVKHRQGDSGGASKSKLARLQRDAEKI